MPAFIPLAHSTRITSQGFVCLSQRTSIPCALMQLSYLHTLWLLNNYCLQNCRIICTLSYSLGSSRALHMRSMIILMAL